MLGVIAIHTGSNLALEPNANNILYMFYEVFSRYSVPGFFFISGFGLFLGYPLQEPLNYGAYLKKRLRGVGLPYVVWSFLYLVYYSLVSPGSIDWSFGNLIFTLFFGIASYHIYFMVILLWFYLLLPLWRKLLLLMHSTSLTFSLIILFIAQIGFNYWSSHFWSYPTWIANTPLLLNLFNFRLNYLPLHYVFIFMMGALAAIHYDNFIKGLVANTKAITAFWLATIVILIFRFYQLLYYKNYSLENITNTLQQLSPEGFLYTISSLLFFSLLLFHASPTTKVMKFCTLLATNSYIIYLIHPFFIDQAYLVMPMIFRNPNYLSIGIYVTVLLCSLLSSIIITKLAQKLPLLALLLLGKSKV